MIGTRAYYYDGKSSRRYLVELSLDAGTGIKITGDGVSVNYDPSQVKVAAAVGSQARAVYFPDDAKCELIDDFPLEDHLPKNNPVFSFIHRLENRWRYLVPSLVIVVASFWAGFEYGVPALARQAAFILPEETSSRLGEDTLAFLDKALFKPSQLETKRIAQLQERFRYMMADRQYQIEFRSSEKMQANALALPSGVIVFTDGMVELASDDEELLAVLAHEIGHIEERHGLRQVIQNSMTAVLMILVAGDITSASSFAATLPVMLMQMKFSRQFESEADDFAVHLLLKQGLDPGKLATILGRMAEQVDDETDNENEADKKEDSASIDFLSTHPATQERIAKINAASLDQ